MPNISYINGTYCSYEDSKIHINDRGYHFGDSVYEVIFFNEDIFYDFDDHIKRLFNSLKSIDIKFSLSKSSLKIIIKHLIKINRASFGSVYIQVSRGIAERNHSFHDLDIKPLLSIIVSKKMNYISDNIVGVKAITVIDNRWARPDIKTTQLLPNVLAKTEANRNNAYEAIFIDIEGYVTEGSSSNIWILNDKSQVQTRSLDGKILSKEEVVALAKLPSLDELRGKIVGLLQAPACKVAGVIAAPAGGLARVVKARSDQLG